MLDFLRWTLLPFVRIAGYANTVGTLVIFALVAIMNIDVIARGIFHAPLRGVVELVIFSLVLIVFLQLPDVVLHNRLTRSEGFLLLLDHSKKAFGNGLRRIIDLSACVFMALAAWTIWPEAIESIDTCEFGNLATFAESAGGNTFAGLKTAFGRCEYFGTPGIFTAPWWPIKLVVAMSLALCTVIFGFKALLGTTMIEDAISRKQVL